MQMKTVGKFAVGAFALVAAGAMCARGDTYHLINKGSSSSPVEWSDVNNWSNMTTAVVGDGYPGASDTFRTAKYNFDGQKGYIALDGDYAVADFTESYNRLYLYKSPNAAGSAVSLTITGTIGGGQYQEYYPYAGAKLVFAVGSTLKGATSDAVTSIVTIYDGGAVDVLGAIDKSRHIAWTVQSGGTLYFAPTSYVQAGDTASINDKFTINGTATFPNGIAVTGGNASWANTFTQNSGSTVTFGGDFISAVSPWTYTWNGGKLAATADATIGDNVSFAISDSASVTLEVASGATFTMPDSASIGAGVSLTKTGAGDLLFAGATLPAAIAVSAGGLALGEGGAYDLSGVAFAAGTFVKLSASGTTLSAFGSSIANATFAVADGYVPASGATVFTCSDATVLAQAQTGLNASLAGTGITVGVSGTSLVAESHYTFNSSTVTDMNDASGWVNNLAAPAGQPAVVSGSSTAAVMDGTVPAYSAITVESGASLTVNATRNLPAATFEAGTTLAVASSAGSVVMESQSHSGYIMNTDTLVGTISPSQGISEITDLAGYVGGGWLGSRDTLYTYVNTNFTNGGTTLRAQFVFNDSDWTKCAIVEFTKDTQGNVYAKGVDARYISPTSEVVDFDEIAYESATYGTSDTDGAYGVKNPSFKAPVSRGGASTVTATGDFVTTGAGSVTVDVAADCVLDLSGVEVTTAATLVKTGSGTIVFGDELPAALSVSAGVLALQPYVEYDMTSVTIGSGATVKVAVDGGYADAIAVAQQGGRTVYVTGATYAGVGTWNTLANWATGVLPGASDAVHVYGGATVLTLDDDTVTLPSAIVVEGGAKLSLAASVSLPPVTVEPGSTLEVASGTVSIANGFTTSALVGGDAVVLPNLAVKSGATLVVPGGTAFKNVAVDWKGTISVTPVGTLTFGYAMPGETSYIALSAEGASFRRTTGGGYDACRLGICCPAPGGTVKAVGDIVFKDMPTIGTHFPSADYYDGLHLGYDNPTSEVFEVVFDNTKWRADGNIYVRGGATFRLKNGSSLGNRESLGYWNRHADVREAGRIVVESGSVLYLNAMGNGGSTAFEVRPDNLEHEAVTVEPGGVFETFRWGGNSKGVFASSNGVLRVCCPHVTYDNGNYNNTNILFRGLSSVRLADESTLTITTRNTSDSEFTSSSGLRLVEMADVPIVGGGSITLSNANDNAFGVVVRSGNNLAAGTASVTEVDGTGDTTLYFADGANWAGTVVAGNVSLTNLTDGASAATVTFGTLDLAADFPVRVWKTGGVVTMNDVLNVDFYAGEETIALVEIDEALAPGDKFIIGKVKSTSALPKIGNHCAARKGVPDGDDYCDVIVKYSQGLQVIIR